MCIQHHQSMPPKGKISRSSANKRQRYLLSISGRKLFLFTTRRKKYHAVKAGGIRTRRSRFRLLYAPSAGRKACVIVVEKDIEVQIENLFLSKPWLSNKHTEKESSYGKGKEENKIKNASRAGGFISSLDRWYRHKERSRRELREVQWNRADW